jgi:hypothetical protein
LRIEVISIESSCLSNISMEIPLSSKQLCISMVQGVAGCCYGRTKKRGEGVIGNTMTASLSSGAATTELRPMIKVDLLEATHAITSLFFSSLEIISIALSLRAACFSSSIFVTPTSHYNHLLLHNGSRRRATTAQRPRDRRDPQVLALLRRSAQPPITREQSLAHHAAYGGQNLTAPILHLPVPTSLLNSSLPSDPSRA